MPHKPQKPCSYPGCSNLVDSGRCDKHTNETTTLYQIPVEKPKRNLAIQRLYDRNWRCRRAAHLANCPWCEDCFRVGIYKPATDVHHVIRHGGDREKFINSPLLSLCHDCHSRRTLGEVSGRDGIREEYYPQIFAHISLNVYMVCGPPASGKTRFVETHQKNGDIVIDLDVLIAEFTKEPIYTPVNPNIVREGIRIRNRRIEALQNIADRGQAVWFIIGAPDPRDRAVWKELLSPKMVYIILTPSEKCFDRIDKDIHRILVADDQKRAVTRWFEKYQPLAGEEIIPNDDNGNHHP